ncbi:unnamed protein product [Protopolystoma xenopodis]|uniref:Uncharacterized protein n=1 Tax=Protopolystoma xenopodis TaxID=117903 RepID=A0A3S5A4I9_9PLAT|nr:unnamed protein product [Protopolystoma xenopodis]
MKGQLDDSLNLSRPPSPDVHSNHSQLKHQTQQQYLHQSQLQQQSRRGPGKSAGSGSLTAYPNDHVNQAVGLAGIQRSSGTPKDKWGLGSTELGKQSTR